MLLRLIWDDLKQASSASGIPLCVFHFIMFKCPSQYTFVLFNDTLKQSSQYIIPLSWPRIARSIRSNRIWAKTRSVIDEMALFVCRMDKNKCEIILIKNKQHLFQRSNWFENLEQTFSACSIVKTLLQSQVFFIDRLSAHIAISLLLMLKLILL